MCSNLRRLPPVSHNKQICSLRENSDREHTVKRSPGGSHVMLLAVALLPFVCALILFGYFFSRFAGEQDTPEIADAMRQMNQAKVIPFPEQEPEKRKSLAAGA